ncbi:hypothetical protein EYF80_049933 [Liparis tanakae]|uniref:Uncharacterized protein n=1 Tax=Liparis tanakae TaxID=230148 RepID=A0A4Z2FG77_9TELE|nr:hypothetical protein EYF80_049933 [Liparis tanakae]
MGPEALRPPLTSTRGAHLSSSGIVERVSIDIATPSFTTTLSGLQGAGYRIRTQRHRRLCIQSDSRQQAPPSPPLTLHAQFLQFSGSAHSSWSRRRSAVSGREPRVLGLTEASRE